MLVDFNPYSPMTDSLLFLWEELLGSDAAGDAAAAVICVSHDGPPRFTLHREHILAWCSNQGSSRQKTLACIS